MLTPEPETPETTQCPDEFFDYDDPVLTFSTSPDAAAPLKGAKSSSSSGTSASSQSSTANTASQGSGKKKAPATSQKQ
jgi:hypothetical protein